MSRIELRGFGIHFQAGRARSGVTYRDDACLIFFQYPLVVVLAKIAVRAFVKAVDSGFYDQLLEGAGRFVQFLVVL
ncbi:hypothetical protein DF021_35730 [Burkholderia stagnalis]|uniref:Uncharacterized protein n=1 Tax=Burkholderia stagnalis TaxID=1503054 RepID=A0ABX9YBM6_9BURK|nr:hypothetical protein DF158_35840 [Burkholderia stagnalis]RQQ58040.1 hypothetical protein DF137_35815 [Burkholderia stagnalis]RQQ71415.1 hypothetical protein DF138_35870 [Burkholderia stagnalis]RQQ78367.1 hypothetical protein DF136_35755 [Burkholderia stagnalis]RQR00205.1 hypothetical protein DF025_36510 [Burkholderia stagnalis]